VKFRPSPERAREHRRLDELRPRTNDGSDIQFGAQSSAPHADIAMFGVPIIVSCH